MPMTVDPEDIRRAVELAKEGLSSKVIGERMGKTSTTINMWLARAGITNWSTKKDSPIWVDVEGIQINKKKT